MRSLVLFAGGRATRLGGVNKALLEVGGRSIVRRILDSLGPLADERVALTNDEALAAAAGLTLVFDPEPHAGVLAALATGLAATHGEVCLAVACDMPFVSATVFQALLDLQAEHDADVVIPRVGPHLEPMHAVYRRQPVLTAVSAALARGDQRMISYFGDVRVLEVEEATLRAADPALRSFFNVNTPDDLDQARRMARH